MMKKETTRDRFSIWKASLFPANYHTDQSLHLNEKAFNGLLASSGIKFHERRKVFVVAVVDTSLTQPLEINPKVRQFLRLPWQKKINTDQLIIHANPHLLKTNIDKANDGLAESVAFFGHHLKHRRIRSHLTGLLTLSAVSAATRLTFLALHVPLPNLIDVAVPITLPIIHEPHITMTVLTTFAVGTGSAGAAQLFIRRPLHERKYEKKLAKTRAYARRIGPIITA